MIGRVLRPAESHFFAELLVERCILEPGTAAVCIREVQRTLTQSAKRLIERRSSSSASGRCSASSTTA